MPNLYADNALPIQLKLRYEVLAGIETASRTLHEQGASDPGWDAVHAHLPKRRATKKLAEDFLMRDTSPYVLKDALPEAPESEDEASVSSSSSASSSTGTSSAPAHSEIDEVAEPEAVESIAWLCSQGQNGHLHIHDIAADSGCRTMCGRCLRTPGEGAGIDAALAMGRPWSPRCWKALPQHVRDQWRAAGRVAP